MYGVAPVTYPPPRLGAGHRLIYLDFDGPLHHHQVLWSKKQGPYLPAHLGQRLFEHAPLLEAAMLPYPEVKIVLSTSWVRHYGCQGTAKRLPPGLRSRVIGATFHTGMYCADFDRAPRGAQVFDDVGRRRPLDWLALDDDAVGWPDACRLNLIEVDEVKGLRDAAILAEVSKRLASWYIHSPGSATGSAS